MGYLFAYQEKTGMSLNEIMKTPWLMIVLGMLTAPSVDFKDKKEKNKKVINQNPKTADEEIGALGAFFGM